MIDSPVGDPMLYHLAAAWWAVHRSDVELDPVSSSDAEWDAYNLATDRVEELSLDPVILPRLIAALARATPAGQDTSYIGTWVLEDANETLSVATIEQALIESRLAPLEIEVISSGWQRR